jgi:pimeloyl-ACP methyl ester carboxylesterase
VQPLFPKKRTDTMEALNLKNTTVENENCILTITYTGSGPCLLVLIPGGQGAGSSYYAALPHLANSSEADGRPYTVATYDRRGFGGSALRPDGSVVKDDLNPAQSARDVAAVISHLGFEKASIYGNSLGATLALQFAVNHPDKFDRMVVHEAPTFTLLLGNEGIKWVDFCGEVNSLFKNEGGGPAFARFMSMTIGWDSTGDDELDRKRAEEQASVAKPGPATAPAAGAVDANQLYWFEHEFLVVTLYTPNLFELREHLHGSKYAHLSPKSVVSVAGKASGKAPYAATTYVQQQILGCQHQVWPGGHLYYVFNPKGFAGELKRTLEGLKD